jgi:5'-deoxynucleotidase YfbR-like HD superfamily hydrolase
MSTSWIQTFTKKKFDPFHPDPSLICIEDIAHALAFTNRFGGHGKRFYSVAQHSLLVSALSAHDDELSGLLHDATEAYLGDILTPIKHTDAFAGYRRAEKHLHEVIFKRFGIEEHFPESVEYADTLALKLEANWLMNPMIQEMAEYMTLSEETLEDCREWSIGLTAHEAEEKFLLEFKRLMTLQTTTEEA